MAFKGIVFVISVMTCHAMTRDYNKLCREKNVDSLKHLSKTCKDGLENENCDFSHVGHMERTPVRNCNQTAKM